MYLQNGPQPAPASQQFDPAGPRYVLGERLGETPTGTFYDATPTDGGDPVLLKHVAPSLFPSAVLRDRALRELRHLLGLAAPGLAAVLGSGLLPDGTLYVALLPPAAGAELLSERVASEGFLDPDQARHIALQVGRALQAAMERGVVHRNLAPYSVYVDDQDDAQLVDFGLAEFREVGWRTVQGPLSFLSPEQAAGRAGTERTLVYGVAALYTYMLTGAAPHGEGDAEAILRRIESQPALSPSKRRSGLTKEIDQLVLRALERSPEARHEGLAPFLEQLARLGDILPSRPPAGPTPGWLLPSLDAVAGDEITEQVLDEDLVAISLLDAPTVRLSPVEEEEEEDLHGRPTMPLLVRQPPIDLTR